MGAKHSCRLIFYKNTQMAKPLSNTDIAKKTNQIEETLVNQKRLARKNV